MRVLFAGTAGIAVPSLLRLAESGMLAGILTNPDARQGRGLALSPSPVAAAAAKSCPDIPVLKPEKLNAAARDEIAALRPDVLAVFAYGKIFGPKFLSLFGDAVNVHPSLLPRWRGPAPIAFALLNRDTQTGLSVQRVALKLDSGDILHQRVWDLRFDETTAELTERAAVEGAEALVAVLGKMEAGTLSGQAQDEERATWSRLLSKEEGIADWSKPALVLDAEIRAFNPWPLSRTAINGKTLFLHKARLVEAEDSGELPGTIISIDKQAGIMVQTGKGILALTSLQWAGKKLVSMQEFMNGSRLAAGTRCDKPE